MPPSPPEFEMLVLNMVGDVAVAQVATHELRFPNQAQGLSYELGLVVGQTWAAKTLIDLTQVQYIGSSAYAVLVGVVKKAQGLGHVVKFCGMGDEVRIGADIIGLDRIAEIHPTEAEALPSFTPRAADAPDFAS